MTTSRMLHRQAMSLASEAIVAQKAGRLMEAHGLFERAWQLEAQAAEIIAINGVPKEPTLSVLYRSAAALALECQAFREVERLVSRGLSGDPPDDIAEELRELRKKAEFRQALQKVGIDLGKEELQMLLKGDTVAFGVVPVTELTKRLDPLQRLFVRTVERLRKVPYREGRKSDWLANFSLLLTGSFKGSFGVTLKVSHPLQPTLPGFSNADQVIDEVVDCLNLFSSGEESQLRERLESEAYYENFMGLAKSLVPDGERINFVGFTTSSQKTVSLERVGRTIAAARNGTDVERKIITDIGKLLYRDALRDNRNQIRLRKQDGGETPAIIVPEGMMSDIVDPLWRTMVEIQYAVRPLGRGSQFFLIDIRPVE